MNPFALLMFITTVSCGLLGMYSFYKRELTGARPLGFLMFAITWWSAMYGLELLSNDLQQMRLLNRISYPAIVSLPVFVFMFVMAILDRREWFTVKRVILLFIVPTIVDLAMWTNEFHWLFYRVSEIDTQWPFPVQKLVHGPLFWINIVYTYVLLMCSIVLLLREWFYSERAYRTQLGIVLLGMAFPMLVNLNYLFKILPVGYIDLTPVAFFLTALFAALSIFKFRLFDLRPIAKETVISNLEDGIVVIDKLGTLIDVNPVSVRLLEIDGDKALGLSIEDAFSRIPTLLDFIESTDSRSELVIGERIIESRKTSIMSKRGKLRGHIVLLTDITDHKRTEEALRKSQEMYRTLATTDMLTGVLNRYSLDQLLERETERSSRYGEPLSVIMFDLDDLKKINDTHGHIVGDNALKAISFQILSKIRKSDSLGRWGGDEFLIVAPSTDLAGALEMAEKLRAEIDSVEFEAIGKLSISMGVSSLEMGEKDYDGLLRRADRALYESKKRGKNRVMAI
ncbi:MAG TPA: histidine kinase N-terminal 7TM domain-containing protein [Mesotoga infera]|nr:histidine kinase N-terminal 7TM domain-containing protein [Mesotoga infera]